MLPGSPANYMPGPSPEPLRQHPSKRARRYGMLARSQPPSDRRSGGHSWPQRGLHKRQQLLLRWRWLAQRVCGSWHVSG